jgi:hypothetical protein
MSSSPNPTSSLSHIGTFHNRISVIQKKPSPIEAHVELLQLNSAHYSKSPPPKIPFDLLQIVSLIFTAHKGEPFRRNISVDDWNILMTSFNTFKISSQK